MGSVQITARVPESLVTRIDKYATEHRWSRAGAVNSLLEYALTSLETEGDGDNGND